MRRHLAPTIATYCILVGAGTFCFLLPQRLVVQSSWAVTPPEIVRLRGTVRDFNQAHADFQATPDAGFGLYAGLVEEWLDADGKPVFAGDGRKVLTSATDNAGHGIAPHRAHRGCSGNTYPNLMLDTRVLMSNSAVIDAYDSSAGPYTATGGAAASIGTNATANSSVDLTNSSTITGDVLVGSGTPPGPVVQISGSSSVTGTVDNMTADVPMPSLPAPSGFGASTGPLTIDKTLAIWSGTRHYSSVLIKRNAVVTVVGETRILVDDSFTLSQNSYIVIPDGSSLTLYVSGPFSVTTDAMVPATPTVTVKPGNKIVTTWSADTSDPSKFILYAYGTDSLVLDTNVQVCGRIFAPERQLALTNGTHLYGTFLGEELLVDNSTGFHVDSRDYYDALTGIYGDATAAYGATGDGGISSGASFDDWFTDILGVNLATSLAINLIRRPDGVYVFDDLLDGYYASEGGFFPVDGMLFGPEVAGGNNDHFTYQVEAFFTYDESGAQFVAATSDADVWVFIDDELVIDLGGVHGTIEQRFDLDRLCLSDGGTYRIAFFVANRYAPRSRLRLETNLVLDSADMATASAGFD